MANDVPRFRKKQRRDGASHTELVPLGTGSLVDGPIGVTQGPRDFRMRVWSFQVVQVGEIVTDHLDCHLARDLARGVTAHPVRDDEQPAVSVG
jgi:hypothetical protein